MSSAAKTRSAIRAHRGWLLLPLLASVAACGSDPASPTSSNRPKADPSAFFAGDLPAYAQELDGVAQSRLLVLRAIRRIDPCALVPKDELAKSAPALVNAAPSDQLDSCRLSFADDGPAERFEVSLVPDADRGPGEEYFQVDGVTVYQGRSGDRAACSFFFDSGLAKYPGAPRDVPDAKIQVRTYRHDNPCGLANSVATAIVKAKSTGIPTRAPAEKVLDEDPCATVADGQKATVDLAGTSAYHCGLVTVPDEHSLWVEFHRLPEKEVAKFPVSAVPADKGGEAQVWTDPAALPLAQLLASAAPSPAPGSTAKQGSAQKQGWVPKQGAQGSAPPKSKAPSGPHCTAYVKVPETAPDPAASTTASPASPPPAQSSEQPVYVVVGGQIDCAQAKTLAGEAASRLRNP